MLPYFVSQSHAQRTAATGDAYYDASRIGEIRLFVNK